MEALPMLDRRKRRAGVGTDPYERLVFHVDMDAFFASVEVMCRPKLKGLPVIVCGKPTTRSVVAAASYPAREYGIRSGMSTVEAFQLCPHAVPVEGNPGQYIYVSLELLRIYKEFSTIVEPYSIDEAFVEMTGTEWTWDNCEEAAAKIKERMRERFPELTASIGIGPNKLIAKMCSGFRKPDGVSIVRPGEFTDVFGDLPVSEIWGVGRKTAVALSLLGISTINELAAFPVAMLRRRFGIMGEILHMMARGRDDTPVTPYFEGMPVKSMGHEHTLPEDTWDIAEAEKVLLRLCDQVARRMRKKEYLGNVISMRLRFADFESIGRQKKLKFYTDEERVIYRVARDLMHQHWRPGHAIRLVGVNCSGLVRLPDAAQMDLFRQREGDSHRKLLSVVDRIRDKFGEHAITRARLVSHDSRMWGAARRVSEPRFQRMRVGSADPTAGMGWSPMSRWHDASGDVDSVPLNSSLSTSPFDMLRRQDGDDRVKSGGSD
jgi:DNA polymerase-4